MRLPNLAVIAYKLKNLIMKTKDILINSVSLSLLATGLSCDSESKVTQKNTETGKPNMDKPQPKN